MPNMVRHRLRMMLSVALNLAQIQMLALLGMKSTYVCIGALRALRALRAKMSVSSCLTPNIAGSFEPDVYPYRLLGCKS